ncbi:hypothetical protein [Mycobacterium tilburgii]|uniref:hypothetical protein n=1 Tax=Mycobacterium tilburgii TaxID=44467 RepID=UPI0038991ABF
MGIGHAVFGRTEIDVTAVLGVADQMRAAAEMVDGAVCDHLAALAFSGATAGQGYTARGDALRAELKRLAAQLSQWSRSL